MSNAQFDTYKKLLALALANPTKAGLRGAVEAAGITIDLDNPHSGYYRLRRGKDGPLDPVAIWREGDDVMIFWGPDQARLEAVWPYCAWQPISYEWYDAKVQKGIDWPDVHTFTADETSGNGAAANGGDQAPGAGHNSEATVDEVTALAKEVNIAVVGSAKYATITTDELRDRSQDLRSSLLELARKAEKRMDDLLAPHLTTINGIKDKWGPIGKSARESATAIRLAQEAYATAKLRKQRAEEAAALALAKEQEETAARLRQQQEQADETTAEDAMAAAERGEPMPEPTQKPSFQFVPPADAPVVPEVPRVAPVLGFRGGTGRAANQKTVSVIEEVIDWKALYAYFIEDQQVRDFVLKRAKAVLKATGEVPPGCRTDVAAKVT